MSVIEVFGQIENLILLGIGVIVVLLVHLNNRISALTKTINEIKADRTVYTPMNQTNSLAGTQAVPDAVIAAISAAVHQYRKIPEKEGKNYA